MIIDKYLYFRAQTDQDSDDGINDSVYVPIRKIRGMTPTSATALTIYFESIYNTYNGAEATALTNDSVVLTVTAGKMQQAMAAIAAAMTSNRLYQDGSITIADDVTTTYLTSGATYGTGAADESLDAGTYIDSSITACASISVTAALS